MAPPSASPMVMPRSKRVLQRPEIKSEEHRAITPASSSTLPVQNDQELVKAFKTDLQSIRTLITCTICDQLLYEPWTLSCGHTYCYSCLCSWFLPNKRKKTCPECRTLIKQMPAPAFLIKQMMDVFINRAALMPLDETADQHRERQQKENADVEADKLCDGGLFKGCFRKSFMSALQFNEEDRIYRCSVCSHEYIGGPRCSNCGIDFDGDEAEIDIDGFSDADIESSLDGLDFTNYDVDLDGETDEDEDDPDIEGPEFWGGRHSPSSIPSDHDEPVIRWGPSRTISVHDGRIRSRNISSSENSEDDEEDEETESMRDFIEDDGVHYKGPGSARSPSNSSRISFSSRDPDEGNNEDEYDEGGEVSNGRRRGHGLWATPSVMTVTDSVTTSEAGELAEGEELRRLQESGWSPLEQEPESDCGEHQPFAREEDSENSDNDTTVGIQATDDEDDDRDRDNESVAPTWDSYQSVRQYYHGVDRGQSVLSNTTDENSENEEYDSDIQGTIVTDPEGDVEMSVSPISSRSSTTNSTTSRRSRRSVEILGSASAIHEIEDDSSDGTVQPASRRRRQLRYSRHYQTPEYDPRISMMFAQHQSDLRDVTARQSPYFEPASRSRTAASYRLLPPRGFGSSSNAHSSSPVILTSISNRPNRVQRIYSRRYFN